MQGTQRPGTQAHLRQAKNVPERARARQNANEYYHQGGRKLAYAGNVSAAVAANAPMVDAHMAIAQKKNAVKNIALIMFVFAILSIVITRYAIISSNNLANYQLSQNIDTIKTDIQDLNLSVAVQDDLGKIKDVAQNDFGMGFPDSAQTRYIEFEDKASTSNTQTQTVKTEQTWLDVVSEWLGTIKNLFE